VQQTTQSFDFGTIESRVQAPAEQASRADGENIPGEADATIDASDNLPVQEFRMLYLVRHGHCDNAPTSDAGLSQDGLSQAEALGEWMSAQHEDGVVAREVDRLLVCPTRRCLGTAQPIAKACGIAAEVCLDLHELGGIGPTPDLDPGNKGMGLNTMFQEFPFIWKADGVSPNGWWTGKEESESACEARVKKVASQMWKEAEGSKGKGAMMLVSHGRFIDALVKRLLGSGVSKGEAYLLHHNTGVTTLILAAKGLPKAFETVKGLPTACVLGVNAMPHLPFHTASSLNFKSKATRIYLIRHAESCNNAHQAGGGDPTAKDSDPALTEKAWAQAQALAAWFAARDVPAGDQITRILATPQQRALQTADTLATSMGLPLEVRTVFHEVGGLYDRVAGSDGHDPIDGACLPGTEVIHGRNFEELQELAPSLTAHDGTITSEGWWRGGKETTGQQLDRARRAVACLWQMASDHQLEKHEGAIAIVGHGKFMDMIMQEMLQVGAGDGAHYQDTNFLSFNTSMNVLDLVPGATGKLRGTVGLVSCNAVPHFDAMDDRGGDLRTAQHRDVIRVSKLIK